MSGGFWAGSIPPWASVVIILLAAVVFILGYLAGESRGRRHEAEDQEREEAMERQSHPVFREARADFDAIREAGRRAWELHHERVPRRTSTAAFLNPPRQELMYGDGPGLRVAASANELTDSAYTEDMARRMDRFLEELCGVPYSADELWSGQ